MTTAILTDKRYAAHTNPTHVERQERLDAIYHALDNSGLENLLTLHARAANDEELAAVHQPAYIQSIKQFSEHGGGDLDPDTYMTQQSWEAALWAAGGAMRLVEAVVRKECDNGFAFIRPPGHHATAHHAMGFCLINNIAVAARYAQQQLGLERVAIVDYDVHHGNGTQDIFYNDPTVLYCSTHASPFYPGTGLLYETGSDAGKGATLNIPLPLGTGDKNYAQVFEHVIVPALLTWKPDIILVSAGYDAHWSDPLGPMVLTVLGYATLTNMLYDVAASQCEGRIACFLEGGYELRALGACATTTLQILQGQPVENDPFPLAMMVPEPSVNNIIAHIQTHHPLFTTIAR